MAASGERRRRVACARARYCAKLATARARLTPRVCMMRRLESAAATRVAFYFFFRALVACSIARASPLTLLPHDCERARARASNLQVQKGSPPLPPAIEP